jgi:hypothetical protein
VKHLYLLIVIPFFYHLEIWTGNEYNCKQDWDNWIKY